MFSSTREDAREYLERLASAIQVPPSKYEDAVRAYRSICQWFERDDSTIKTEHQESFLQGSFRLGTAIRPTTEEDDYDLDIVVVLGLAKLAISQAELKRRVGVEVKSYAKSHGMTRPKDARRCWTQNYVDQRQFHVDTLPSVPDAQGLREQLEARNLSNAFVTDAIAITDKTDTNYNVVNPRWPNSNPRGYAAWFESRMGEVLAARKAAIALLEGRATDDVPTYEAQTPLQKTVQLLKYHRDIMFADDPDDRPISIIITTLAAHAYQGETDLDAALQRVLSDMHLYIEEEFSIDWVRNPTNGLENFAYKWIQYPKRRENFYRWLETARSDFEHIAAADDARREEVLSESFGDEIAAKVARRQLQPRTWEKRKSIFAPHRQTPPWSLRGAGTVKIKKATWAPKGSFRTRPFSSDSKPVPKNVTLRFYASTDIPQPYEVYWQIVNILIPAFVAPHAQVSIFKTDHHPDYKRDWRTPAWEVARATSAAPTFFAGHQYSGSYFLDGGLFANNPIMLAIVEAMHAYDIRLDQIRVLSIGTGNRRPTLKPGTIRAGMLGWRDAISTAMYLTTDTSLSQARLLLGFDAVVRLEPSFEAASIELDDWRSAHETMPPEARSCVSKKSRSIDAFLSDKVYPRERHHT